MPRVLWIGCLLVGLMAPSASADPDDEALAEYEQALAAADVSAARKVLAREPLSFIVQLPYDAMHVCGLAQVFARKIGEEGREPEEFKKLIEDLFKIAEGVIEKHGDKGTSHKALACAKVAKGRGLRAMGEEVEPDLWIEAAALARKAAGMSKDYRAWFMSDSAKYIGEAAPPGDEKSRAAWYAAKIEEIREAGSSDEAGADTRIEFSEFALAHARTALEARDKKTAKSAAEEGLAVVAMVPEADEAYVLASIMFNALLRFARDCGPMKLDFRVKEQKSSRGVLQFELPAGWNFEFGDGDQLLGTLERGDESGTTTVGLYRYSWNSNYRDSSGKSIGGDSASGLANMDREREHERFDKVLKERKKVGGKLSRDISKTTGYEIVGEKKGRVYWLRSYYFKGDVRKETYLVAVTKKGGEPGMDPELESVLESFKEVPLGNK